MGLDPDPTSRPTSQPGLSPSQSPGSYWMLRMGLSLVPPATLALSGVVKQALAARPYARLLEAPTAPREPVGLCTCNFTV